MPCCHHHCPPACYPYPRYEWDWPEPNPRNSAKVALSSDVVGIQQVVSLARKVDLLAVTSSGNLSHMRHFPAYRVSLALLPIRPIPGAIEVPHAIRILRAWKRIARDWKHA
jgi:hypothetical protein